MARTKPAPSPAPGRRSQRLDAKTKRKEEANVVAAAGKDGIPKPKPFRRPRQRKRCHLINMPGEIRNLIYEAALVSNDHIRVTANGPGEPALLSACRRIRREAGTLYYSSNTFELKLESYNGAAFVPWARQARKFFTGRRQPIEFVFDRMPNWDNLVAWIHAFCEKGALVPDWKDLRCSDSHVVAGAFRLVDQCQFWRAEKREEVLQTLYTTLRGTYTDWVKPEDIVYT